MLNDSLLHNLASLHWFWQSTLCIGIGLLGSFLLRQRPTRAHQVLFWSMTAACILPALSALVKHYNLGLLQPEPTKTVSVATPITEPISVTPADWTLPATIHEHQDSLPVVLQHTPHEYASMETENYDTEIHEAIFLALLTDNPVTQTSPPASAVPPVEKRSIPWSFWAIGGWILITAILLSRLLLNFVGGMRLLHKSQKIDSPCVLQALRRAKSKLQIPQSVSIFQSCRIKTPVIWCWFSRPILLIPESVNPSGKKIDWISVFCHELAHWKRRDHWCCLVAELLVCILWPNPLVWWAKQRLIRLSEQACDDWVVAAGQSKIDYADSLLNLVPQGRMTLVPTVIGGKKEMKNRIKRIIQDRGDNPRISSRWTWLIGLMAIGLALGLALTQTRAAERDEDREREQITKETDEDRIVHPEERERAERDVNLRELDRELQELKKAEGNRERRLKGLRDGQDEEARELQTQLRRIREEMKDVKRALYESSRERQEDRDREHAEGYRDLERREQEHAERAELRRGLAREMQELQERARDLEHEMKELGVRHPERRRELQAELREIHERMKDLEWDMKGFDRERAGFRDRDMYEQETIREKLMHERHKLEEIIHEIEQELEEIGDEKAHQLKRVLEQTVAELRQVERQLQQDRPDRERPDPFEMKRHLADLKKAIQLMAAQGKHDEAEQLERQAREIMQHLKEHPDAPRPPRLPEMPRLESRPDLERQIQELRGQVGEMRQEMKEIRGLLRELLEQKRER